MKNREILFIYDGMYCQPNGDPGTKEQRFDSSTGKILTSDVRIKRYIRDFLYNHSNKPLYMIYDDATKAFAAANPKLGSGSSARVAKLRKDLNLKASVNVILECVDGRTFGGVNTEKKKTAKKGESDENDDDNDDEASTKVTGAVQFDVFNPSMHTVYPILPQFTTIFPSKVANTTGSIGTMSIVPYFVNQIHGKVCSETAKYNKTTEDDLAQMYGALWLSLYTQSSRSKQSQRPLLLVDIVYSDIARINNGTRLIKLEFEGEGTDLREDSEKSFDYTQLGALQDDERVEAVNFFTDNPTEAAKLQAYGSKFKKMTLGKNYELR